jgi:hypothetical protein
MFKRPLASLFVFSCGLILVAAFFSPAQIRAQGNKPTATLDSEVASVWYENSGFGFKIKKIPGWEFKDIRGLKTDIAMLSLAFVKDSSDGDFKNTVIINVAKLRKPPYYTGVKGFTAQADGLIQSSVSNLKGLNFLKQPTTISPNNLEAREAIFQWEDEQRNNEKFISTLVIFTPFATNYDILNASLLFKCKAKDYLSLRDEVEATIMSIQLGT